MNRKREGNGEVRPAPMTQWVAMISDFMAISQTSAKAAGPWPVCHILCILIFQLTLIPHTAWLHRSTHVNG